MEYQYITRLQTIIDSIKNKGNETVAFSKYVNDISLISPQSFNKTLWTDGWRKIVNDFGTLFINLDAGPYLVELQDYIQEPNKISEIVAFIHSELIWNYFESDGEYNRDTLKRYIQKFPHNPEFHNTYALFLLKNKTFDKAVFEHHRAINIDATNAILVSNYITTIKDYFDSLIRKSKTEEAKALLDNNLKYIKQRQIDKLPLIGNKIVDIFFGMEDRVRDHEVIQQQIEYYKKEISVVINSEQKKLIEVLGIFSAIIAFILTNISIGISGLQLKQMMALMIGMAIVLLIFAISISFLFGQKLHYPPRFYFLRRPKFWSLLVLSIILFLLYLYI